MPQISLFEPTTLGPLELKNRLVMASMTRCRAVDANAPNALMAEYYEQRAGAGLIISEGTSPSPNGTGYARIPGIWSPRQVAGWKVTTDAVHAMGGHIVMQLMHTGRVGHALNLPEGGELLAPSAIASGWTVHTDAAGRVPCPVPRAMAEEDVRQAIEEYVLAAHNAIVAGFDGVELHASNGHLIEQFISPITNQRTDRWGGSIKNRLAFVLEVAWAIASEIGAERFGIRITPHGTAGGMAEYAEIEETYMELIAELAPTGMQYVHVVDHSATGGPAVPDSLKRMLRNAWPRTFILSGGFDLARAELALDSGRCDLVGFGRPFLANPDLVERMLANAPLNEPDLETLYTPGPKGYTDYPRMDSART